MKTEEQEIAETTEQKKMILSALSNLSVVAVLFYFLGWRYWVGYFDYFNIPISLIDIPFERILLTASGQLLNLFIAFSFASNAFFQNHDDDYLLGPTIGAIGFAIMTYSGKIEFWFIYSYAAIGILIMLVLKYRKFKYKTIPKNNFTKLILIVAYLFGIYYYNYMGEKAAISTYKNSDPDVKIITNNNRILLGKFVYYSGGKFFLIINDQNNKKHITAIESSAINQTEFFKATTGNRT